jgi:hypothetical protein
MWDLTVPGNNDHDFYVLPEVIQDVSGGRYYDLHEQGVAAAVLVHNDNLCGAPSGSQAIDHNIEWVRESGGPYTNPLRQAALDYERGAPGVRIDPQTGQSLVPRLTMESADGGVVGAKFDSINGGELIDRKNGVLPFTSESMIDEARRQAGISAYHGLQVIWEVPNVNVEQDALRWLNDAGVSNIEVRIAP